MFSRRSSVSIAQVVGIGKIPTFPEFLQPQAVHEPAHSFDAWLEAGISLAGHRYGATWQSSFEAGGAYGFVWRAPRGRSESILCGTIMPSRDSVGRHFPFAAVTTIGLDQVMQAPHVVPLAFGEFLDSAYDATADLSRLDPAEVQLRLGAQRPPGAAEIAHAKAEYDAWIATTPAPLAWSGIFDDHPVERAHAAISSIARAAQRVRFVESPVEGVTLRLPLGRGGPAAAALWLDIVKRLCGWRTTVPSAFWAEGSLLVALGDAPPSALSALWLRDPTGDVYDPTMPNTSGEGAEWAPPSGLSHSYATINDLLNSLSS